MNPRLKRYQTSVRRSANGKLLGVFTGLAESWGHSVCLVRVLGVIVLLSIAGAFGVEGFSASILSAGFFYLLAAMLMRPPLNHRESVEDGEMDLASVYPPRRETQPRFSRPAAVPHSDAVSPRVDLAQLDRQLDSLNRRIQRMESIVTDRQYDWDRRMNG